MGGTRGTVRPLFPERRGAAGAGHPPAVFLCGPVGSGRDQYPVAGGPHDASPRLHAADLLGSGRSAWPHVAPTVDGRLGALDRWRAAAGLAGAPLVLVEHPPGAPVPLTNRLSVPEVTCDGVPHTWRLPSGTPERCFVGMAFEWVRRQATALPLLVVQREAGDTARFARVREDPQARLPGVPNGGHDRPLSQPAPLPNAANRFLHRLVAAGVADDAAPSRGPPIAAVGDCPAPRSIVYPRSANRRHC